MAARRDKLRLSAEGLLSSNQRRPGLASLTDSMLDLPLEVDVATDGSVQVGRFALTPVGLRISGSASEDEWQKLGAMLQRVEGSVQWLIGDWYMYAERQWGRTYEQVAELTGYAEKTLREYASVARRVDLSIRMDKLTFGHHQVVAGMEPELQRQWLEWAAREGASISQMRKAIDGQTFSPALPGGVSRALRSSEQEVERIQGRFDKMGQGEQLQLIQKLEAALLEMKRKVGI